MRKTILFTLLSLISGEAALAGALSISNVELATVNRKSAAIQLDLSWQCAWRDEVNHDAVWLFAKYSLDDGETWRHATLRGSGVNPKDYSAGSDAGLDILVPEDRKGAYVRNKVEGIRSPVTTGLRLVWDFDADGVSKVATARIRVFGLEMVYIPEGPFVVGEEHARKFFNGYQPTLIESPDATNRYGLAGVGFTGTGTNEDPYRGRLAGLGRPYTITTSALTNDYPNGYRAFYLMKQELTRQSFLDFLNTLSETQRAALLAKFARVDNKGVTHYNFWGTSDEIVVATLDNGLTHLSNAQPWRVAVLREGTGEPYGYSADEQFLAYLDWAALRPMTDLEFEKACRGPRRPIPMEMPWGTPSFATLSKLQNANTASERAATVYTPVLLGGSYSVRVTQLPQPNWHACIDAADAAEAGASYYGALDMVGNGTERCVYTASGNPAAGNLHSAARYSGLHGDGELTANGLSNVTDWPYPKQNYYATGPYTSRGGQSYEDPGHCTVSGGGTHLGDNYYGECRHSIRGVRTVTEQ